MDEKLEINCAAVGARLYFDEAAEWEAAKEAATAAGNMERAHVCATNAEANRVAGRNALLQAGLPADQAATIEPVRLVKLTAEDVALAVTVLLQSREGMMEQLLDDGVGHGVDAGLICLREAL